MSSNNSKKIIRQYIGEIPILQHIANRLAIKEGSTTESVGKKV